MSDNQSLRCGIALTSGGTLGAYHVGVLKAFRELGGSIDVISGCSIGAINGAVLACSQNLDAGIRQLERAWTGIASETEVSPILSMIILMLEGCKEVIDELYVKDEQQENGVKEETIPIERIRQILDRTHDEIDDFLENLLNQYLNLDQMRRDVPVYASVYKSEGQIEDLIRLSLAELGILDTSPSEFVNLQQLNAVQRKDVIIASAAVPLLMRAKTIGRHQYIDGAVGGRRSKQGSTPVQPIVDEGCNVAIVVHLQEGSLWTRDNFPSLTCIEVRPRKDSLGTILGDLLCFDEELIRERIELGYRDGKDQIGSVLDALNKREDLRQASLARQTSEEQLAESESKRKEAMAALRDSRRT